MNLLADRQRLLEVRRVLSRNMTLLKSGKSLNISGCDLSGCAFGRKSLKLYANIPNLSIL
jgi:hypothetical protein